MFKSVETCRSLVSGRILLHQVLTVDSLTLRVPYPLTFGATSGADGPSNFNSSSEVSA